MVEEEKKLEIAKTEAFLDYDEGDDASEIKEDHDYELLYFGADFDIAGLVKRFGINEITIPSFQRQFVWNKSRASRFIESLLLGLPSPEMFFYQQEDAKMQVVDGYQRLSTLKNFYNKDFQGKPFKLYYPNIQKRFEQLTYDDLPPDIKRKLDYTIIHCTVVRTKTPKKKNYQSVYHLFDRLNSGGMNLTPQEIRNCMFIKSVILEFLKQDKVSNFFTDYMQINSLREKHQEVALRVLALSNNLAKYTGNMNRFLNGYLDENKISQEDKENYLKTIDYITKRVNQKNLKLENSKSNLAILDAIFVGIFKNIDNIEKNDLEVNKLIEEALKEKEFKDYITTGRTHDTKKMKGRINFFLKKFE